MSLGGFEVRDKKFTIRTSIRIGRNMAVWFEIGRVTITRDPRRNTRIHGRRGRRGRGSYGIICNSINEVAVTGSEISL